MTRQDPTVAFDLDELDALRERAKHKTFFRPVTVLRLIRTLDERHAEAGWLHPRLGVAALREQSPPDFGEQMLSSGALPKDLQKAIDDAAGRRSDTGYAYVSAEIIGAAVHDLTTSITHKAAVMAGRDDECMVFGRAIAARLRADR